MDNGVHEYFISNSLGVNCLIFKAAFYVIGLNRIKMMVMTMIMMMMMIIIIIIIYLCVEKLNAC
jgi:hypothetical protein